MQDPAGGCRGGAAPPTHFPIVRGSAINGPGWSAGDARNRIQIIELEVVARDGIEPSTRWFEVLRHLMLDAASPKAPVRGQAEFPAVRASL
jgi:hypothetical protein